MSKNAFKRHGIEHLSASTINTWIAQPALCLLKIAGIKDGEAGPAAWRGNAIDRVAAAIARKPTIERDELRNLAKENYQSSIDRAADNHSDTKIQDEQKMIDPMIDRCMEFYSQLPEKFKEEQGKVSVKIGDIPLWWIGYFDLLYEDKVRDVKSVGRTTNRLLSNAARQASIYALGTGREPWVDYVSKTKVNPFKVYDVSDRLREIERAAFTLERTLSFSDDIFECCRCVFPDMDHFFWGETTKLAAIDIWRLNQ